MPPFDGGGSYTLPSGYQGVANTPILVTQHNPPLEDIAAALTLCVKRNGAGAMTGLLTLSGDPSTALQAATKQYVDAAAAAATAGLKFKPSVLVATTANITLSAEQTIDGVLTSASRVLVKNQTAPAENGIYVTGSGAWARATDMDAWSELPSAIVAVEQGTKWADTIWLCRSDTGGTLNTTAVNFRRFDANQLRNAQTGTSYTVVADDHGQQITYSNASAIAVTHPQATGNFGAGFKARHNNIGAGFVTITPTTSTINGTSSLVLYPGQWADVESDGANLRATIGGTPRQTWPLGFLSGLTLSRASSTTFGIAVGACANEDGGTQWDMTLSSAFTKSLNSWAVGTGNGGIDTGSVANNTWYHVHLIRKDSDGSIDVLYSTSATSPTMPSGYTARRRLGSFLTNGSAQIVNFSQVGDEFLWDVAIVDVDATNPGTSAVTRTLTVPTNVKVIALLSVGGFVGTTTFTLNITSLDTSDQATQAADTGSLTGFATNTTRSASSNGWNFSTFNVRTNTSGQVRSRISASGASDRLGIITRGWIDLRGK